MSRKEEWRVVEEEGQAILVLLRLSQCPFGAAAGGEVCIGKKNCGYSASAGLCFGQGKKRGFWSQTEGH